MTHGVPAGLEGQIASPNSLELLWDKYKRFVYGVLIAIGAAIAVDQIIGYLDRRATDERWAKFVASAGLAKKYVDLPEFGAAQQQQQTYAFKTRLGLLSELAEDIGSVDRGIIEGGLDAAAGNSVLEPLMLWILGVRASIDHDYDDAQRVLGDLQQRFPEHFLCVETDYPVQWRPEVEKDDEEEGTRSRRQKPELEPAVRGSTVGLLLERIEAEQGFRAEHARFYEAPEPDSTEVVVIKLADDDGRFDGEIKIRLYTERAPEHARAFLAAIRDESFFDGLRIHNVERMGTDPQITAMVGPGMRPSAFKFGLPVTRDEEDRTKWTNASGTVAEEHVVPWEDTGVSHFPGMLAAEPHSGGKSQIERLVINGDDVAASNDGQRVVFGRVVEGLELVRRVIEEIEFRSESDARVGRGTPGDSVRIESITVE